jgi:hypothetical protein
LPGFLGGVIAVIGAVFAAPYVLPENMRPVTSLEPVENRIAEQADRLSQLSERVDTATGRLESLPSGEELAALEERLSARDTEGAAQREEIAAGLEELGGTLGQLGTRVDELAAQLEELERRPLEDSADPEVVSALRSYGEEVAALREEITGQTEALRAEVEEQTAANAQRIEEAARATEESRAAAEEEARSAAEREALAGRQQALVDIQSALESGRPFAEPLSRLDGVEVPQALAAVAEEGVPTLAALQADFAEPARAALNAARRAAQSEDPVERGLNFLETQLGIRSLAPQEGDSADAILSRAEDAVRNGDLRGAIEELRSLPEPALQMMADWIERAERRAAATAAADELAASLASN